MIIPFTTTEHPSSRSNTLRLLFANEKLSRKDVATALNISTAAVTPIINDLHREGIIELINDSDGSTNSVGRRQSYFQINKNWKHVLALNIYPDYIYYAVTNLIGETLYQEKVQNILLDDEQLWIQQIAYHCIDLLRQRAIPMTQIIGVGITIVGPVNHEEGIALHPFNMFDHPVSIKEYFEKYLPCPVAIESNVCASLRSELLFRRNIQNCQNVIMLKWGPGIGSALSINGHNYKGYNYQSSEIGHNTFSSSIGKKCRCGRCGCLETLISEDAMIHHITRYINDHRDPDLNCLAANLGMPSSENIMQYADQPPALLKEYLTGCIKKLSLATNNAIMLMSPEKIVLVGKFFMCDWMFEDFINDIFEKNPLLNKELFIRSYMEQNRTFIGATTIAIENAIARQ